MTAYDESLRARTRTLLHDIPVTPDGFVHMKHPGNGQFGRFDSIDLVNNRHVLHLKDEQGVIEFADIDAVIDAGWLID